MLSKFFNCLSINLDGRSQLSLLFNCEPSLALASCDCLVQVKGPRVITLNIGAGIPTVNFVVSHFSKSEYFSTKWVAVRKIDVKNLSSHIDWKIFLSLYNGKRPCFSHIIFNILNPWANRKPHTKANNSPKTFIYYFGNTYQRSKWVTKNAFNPWRRDKTSATEIVWGRR